VKRLLVTGSNGLLGTKLVSAARRHWYVVGMDLQPDPAGDGPSEYVRCDITDGESVHRWMAEARPNAVVHAAAFTDVDACEIHRDAAWSVNVRGTETVASTCLDLGIPMVHLSTDYVFDGTGGPYAEDAGPHALSSYGKMKLESERVVQRLVPRALIVRTMILYGHHPSGRRNFVTWLVDKLARGEEVHVVTDQFGNPTWADDLADALLVSIEKNLRGLYHMAGPEWLHRHAFAVRVAEAFGLDASLIHETTSDLFKQRAPRPLRSGLTTAKFTRDAGFRFRCIDESFLIMKKQMVFDETASHQTDAVPRR
jgi:dTDP-4-dehydrorhamnose reductase